MVAATVRAVTPDAKTVAVKAKSKPKAKLGPQSKATKATTKVRATAPSKSRSRKVRTLPPAAIAEMFRRFHASVPEPKGELEFVNPFTLLVAVVLSAQATDVGVNKATRPLFKIAPTPEAMVALGEDTVRDYVKSIGLFRNKAKNVVALSEQLIANHGGVANVVLNMAFGVATMAVDTHVFRVANRTGMAPGKDVVVVEQALLKVVPEAYGVHAHHWLILHGRYTCLARKPLCNTCPIHDLCLFDEKPV
jgi:endonuclease III